LKKYEGRVVVIIDDKVVGNDGSFDDAYFKSV
jgi:hypothetical protein